MVLLSLQFMLIRQRGEGVFFDVGTHVKKEMEVQEFLTLNKNGPPKYHTSFFFWANYNLTDGTPFSSAHAYKAKGGRSLLRCGTHVKKEMGVQEFPTSNKNSPYRYHTSFFFFWANYNLPICDLTEI